MKQGRRDSSNVAPDALYGTEFIQRLIVVSLCVPLHNIRIRYHRWPYHLLAPSINLPAHYHCHSLFLSYPPLSSINISPAEIKTAIQNQNGECWITKQR